MELVIIALVALCLFLINALIKTRQSARLLEKDRNYQRQRLHDEYNAQTAAGCTCTWNGENG